MPKQVVKYSLFLVCLAIYVWLGYFIERSQFTFLITGMAVLFAIYFFWLRKGRGWSKYEIWFFAILFRVVLLFSTPNLSDDYYRFVWDGNLLATGYNPIEYVPSQQPIAGTAERNYLQHQVLPYLNSPGYYSVYPPVNQLCFGMAAIITGNNLNANVFVLKVLLLLFEIVTITLLFKLLRWYKKRTTLAIIYALNPLVVIEVAGNIHFEGVMMAMLLFGFWCLVKQKWLLAGLGLALAVCTKLWPLMFLPFLIRFLGWGRSIQIWMYTLAFCIVFFLPFLSETFLQNFSSSLNLYFQKFEFNASAYYVLRWVGYELTGYNLIRWVGPALAVTVLFAAAILWYRQKRTNLVEWMSNSFWLFFAFLFLSTIVHPWYLLPLVAFSVFVKWRFALVWSAMVFLSYYAYSNNTYTESYWLIALEYSVVIGFLIWEWRFNRPGASAPALLA